LSTVKYYHELIFLSQQGKQNSETKTIEGVQQH